MDSDDPGTRTGHGGTDAKPSVLSEASAVA